MDKRKHRVFLSLGSNLGDRKANLEKGLILLESDIGQLITSSSIYVTEAWGGVDLSEFYNLVTVFETHLNPFDLLEQTQKIEKQLGRSSKSLNGCYQNRVIDIDILFFNDDIIESDRLKVPHPLLHKRKFVLMPMNEIFPKYTHPQLNIKISNLLEALEEELECTKL